MRDKLKERADKGDADAIFELALLYAMGDFGKNADGQPDYETAKDYYLKAVAREHVKAMYNLALLYAKGYVGKTVDGQPDFEKAKEYLQCAVDHKFAAAMLGLAVLYHKGYVGKTADGQPDYETAKDYYLKAVALTHADAMNNLAVLYHNGHVGKKADGQPDYETAKDYYLKAVALNHAIAMVNLAVLYKNGLVDKENNKPNYRKAQDLFDKAILLGDKDAEREQINPVISKFYDLKTDVDIVHLLVMLENAVIDSRKNHILTEDIKSICHFTAKETILNLLAEDNKNRLRYYHSDYMNDPKEGRRIIDFIQNKPEYRLFLDAFDDNNQNIHCLDKYDSSVPSVYIVSFSSSIDRLDLWRAYGRDGTGFAIQIPIELLSSHHKDRVNAPALEASDKLEAFTTPQKYLEKLPVFAVKYKDSDIKKFLEAVKAPLKALDEFIKANPDQSENVLKCIYAIMLEVLYLFKDEQYENEKEVRSIRCLTLNNQNLMIDQRQPGHIYCESPAFLFTEKNSKIALGPKVQEPHKHIWEIRYLLQKRGLLENTVIEKSKVEYR